MLYAYSNQKVKISINWLTGYFAHIIYLLYFDGITLFEETEKAYYKEIGRDIITKSILLGICKNICVLSLNHGIFAQMEIRMEWVQVHRLQFRFESCLIQLLTAHYFVESIDVFVEKKDIHYLFGIPNK